MENLTFEDWVSIVFRIVASLSVFAGLIAYVVRIHFKQTYINDKLDSLDKKIDGLDTKVDNMEKRLDDKIDNLSDSLNARMNRIEDKLDKLFFHLIGIDDHQLEGHRGEQRDKDE